MWFDPFVIFQKRCMFSVMSEVKTFYSLSYLSTACVHRRELCCPLVLMEPPVRCRRPHTGLQWCHRSSVQVMRCRCSCCCFPTALPCSHGCCQSPASTPAGNCRPTCRAWRPKDSRRLRNTLEHLININLELLFNQAQSHSKGKINCIIRVISVQQLGLNVN